MARFLLYRRSVASRLRQLIALSVLVLIAAAAPAAAANKPRLHKLDLVLRDAATRAPEPQRVIIQAVPGRRAAIRAALQAHGDVVEAEHPALDAMTAYVHGEDLVALDGDPSVLWVSCDCEVTVCGAPRLKSSGGVRSRRTKGGTSTNTETSEVGQLLGLGRAVTGAGVRVAILDSGIEPSNDFTDRIAGFWDFTRGGGPATPYDDYGHGTHIAGLIASSGVLSGGKYRGVAPDASLYVFKVLDGNGRGRTSTVIRALEYITANVEQNILDVDIINLSLGHPIMEPASRDPLVQAVEAAVRAGIVVVVSAGNNGANPDTGEIGYAGINSPGNARLAITAGAAATQHTVVRLDDRVAPFSSRGPTWYDGYAKPDVVAPGVAMVANIARRGSLIKSYPSFLVDTYYARLSGTSMASAVTTGVVSLVLEANRSYNLGAQRLTPNAVKAIVEYTATPLADENGLSYDALTQGTGEVNGEGAVRLAASIDTSVLVGQYWTGGVQPYTYFGTERTAWAENIVWGNVIVGGGVALVNSLAWDDNIVWGTAIERDGDNIVWGTFIGELPGLDNIVWGSVDFGNRDDNIVWGTSYVGDWADNIVWGSGFIGYSDGDNIVWGSSRGSDNIVWGSLTEDNIVWGNLVDGNRDNIVWGSGDGDNIVWGNSRGGGSDGDNIVWGTAKGGDDNIVWGSARSGDDNIVWGSAAPVKKNKTR